MILRNTSARRTLGTGRDLRRRLILHHLPIAVLTAIATLVFMGLSPFSDANAHPDLTSGPFPQQWDESTSTAMDHGALQAATDEQHGGGRASQGAFDLPSPGGRVFVTQLTIASGYAATVLLALTLLIGPANLLLRRRNPVSTYLRRDVGIWTAIVSVVHVVFALQGEVVGASMLGFLDLFVIDGRPLTNSFGWGNWTGLIATVIVLVLLVTSTDRSMRELRARPWKSLQRLTYTLFALVVAHAFFYGALVQPTSPFALLLLGTVAVVLAGQAIGIWLWRRRDGRTRQPSTPEPPR